MVHRADISMGLARSSCVENVPHFSHVHYGTDLQKTSNSVPWRAKSVDVRNGKRAIDEQPCSIKGGGVVFVDTS